MPNYQVEMEEEIAHLQNVPTLLLHSCCGPCSSYVISCLSDYFDITVFFYNPNIEPKSEYEKRKENQKKFIKLFTGPNKLTFIDCDYDNQKYHQYIDCFQQDKEGGTRCAACFLYRLEHCASYAKEHDFTYFCTTLTVSPHKNSVVINKIGNNLSHKYQIKYLNSDFKKKDGYKKSVLLSNQYGLYRQDYCGCLLFKER